MLSLEKNIRLSESCLWQAQRDYFARVGINAWQRQVPFFATSNPVIAEGYAKLIAAFLGDLEQIDSSEPVYIFELGTGSGQFSFYCHKALQSLSPKVEFCYVMTDFAIRNIEFWEQQTVLQTARGLDFAELDLEHPQAIHLRRQNLSLSALKNPCILIANYLFDSLPQDCYAMEKGLLLEKHIETLIPVSDYDRASRTIHSLRDIQITERSRPYEADSSENPYLDFYLKHLKQGLFSLPLGGFKALDFIRTLAPKGFMLLCSDKGYNTLTEIEACQNLNVVTHGSFSLDVNFHALGLYFENLGGRAKFQSYRDGIKTNLFLSKAEPTPALDRTYAECCEGFSPADYFQYHQRFRESLSQGFDLNFTLSQLILSRFDPYVFSLCIDKIGHAFKIESTPAVLIEAYCQLLPKLYANIYPLPKDTDHFFNLGLLLHILKRYTEAIPYFEGSLACYGDRFASLYNLGICKHLTGAYSEARVYFEKALPLAAADQGKVEAWLKFCYSRAEK